MHFKVTYDTFESQKFKTSTYKSPTKRHLKNTKKVGNSSTSGRCGRFFPPSLSFHFRLGGKRNRRLFIRRKFSGRADSFKSKCIGDSGLLAMKVFYAKIRSVKRLSFILGKIGSVEVFVSCVTQLTGDVQHPLYIIYIYIYKNIFFPAPLHLIFFNRY